MWRFILILWLALPFAAFAQDDDRGYLTAFLEDNLSGAGREVRITGFQGALSSRATLEEMTIADAEGIWLTLRGVELDWNRAALLGGRVSVNALTAQEIIVARPPVAGDELPSPEATPFALPELPVSIEIGRLAAERLELGAPVLGTALEAKLEAVVLLSGGEGGVTLNLERTDDGPSGRAVLNASYANETRVLVLDLDATEGASGIVSTLAGLPGAPALQLKVAGSGPIDDYQAQIQLATDGVDRLAGTVTLRSNPTTGQRFAAQLAGDVAPLFLPAYAEFFGPDMRLETEGARDASGRLDLSKLTLVTRALTLDGAVVIGAGGLPEKVALSGRIGSADGTPVLLPLSTDQETRIGGADVTIRYDMAAGEDWTGSASVTGLDRADFRAAQVELTGSGRIRQDPVRGLIGATLHFAATGLAPSDKGLAEALGDAVTGTATLFWQQGTGGLKLPRLTLEGQGYALTAAGGFEGLSTGITVKGKATARIDDLSRAATLAGQPLAGAASLALQGEASLLAGSFDVTGDLTGTDLAIGMAEVDGLLKGTSQIAFSALRDTEGTTLRQLDVAATSLTAAVTGTIATAGSDLSANLAFADLSVLGGPYRGALTGRARLTGTLDAGQVSLDADGTNIAVGVPEVDALLRGASEIRIAAGLRDGGADLREFRITAANLQATATGRVAADASDVTAELAFPDLSVMGGPYRGALNADASFRGTVDAGQITLDATGNGIGIGVPEADALLRGASTITLQAGLDQGALDVQNFRIAAANLVASAQGRLATAGSDFTAELNFPDLSVLGGPYRGTLAAQAAFTGTPEAGRLTANATGNGLAIGQAEADRLLAGRSALVLALNLDNGRIRVDEARLTNPQLTVNASGTAEGSQRNVTLDARLANLGLVLPEFPGPLTLSGTAQDNGSAYELNLRAQGPGQIDLRSAGRLASDFSSADLTVTGSAQSALANAFIAPRTISGPLRFDLRLNGPLQLSSLSGRVSLAGARISDPDFGLALVDTALTANLAGGRAQISASATASEGGQMNIAGGVGLSAPYDADLTITLARLILKDPELFQTRLNGTVTLNGGLTGGGQIGGSINLIETELRIPSTGLGGAAELEGLRHVNEPAPVRATRIRAGLIETGDGGSGGSTRPLGLDLTISAPNRVFIRGRGLDAELGGSLRLTGTTNAIVPSGAFNLIRGRLDILGKRLNLSEALLQLEGDFAPFVRIAASNESDGIVSSVVISGEATAPVVSFTSAPELPEEEVLARLLFGRELTSLSALQAAQLASAVATLAGRGGDGIVGRLRKGFGLDDLDLATDAEGDTSLRAGKYLSRNLYTEVEVDQQGQSQINLNLDVTKSITLRGSTSSDGETGLGIFIEKDY